jgi:protein-tyrosine-phosphatase
MNRTILFLCPHNAAKSVIAVAYFEQLATQHGLDFRATSAGTEPDAEPATAVVEMLEKEGIDVSKHVPRHVTREELADAFRVVSLGCDVSELAPVEMAMRSTSPFGVIAHWDDVPPPSQNLMAARDSILKHVERLINELKQVD